METNLTSGVELFITGTVLARIAYSENMPPKPRPQFIPGIGGAPGRFDFACGAPDRTRFPVYEAQFLISPSLMNDAPSSLPSTITVRCSGLLARQCKRLLRLRKGSEITVRGMFSSTNPSTNSSTDEPLVLTAASVHLIRQTN